MITVQVLPFVITISERGDGWGVERTHLGRTSSSTRSEIARINSCMNIFYTKRSSILSIFL